MFSAHDRAEGAEYIRRVLKKNRIPGHFFLTGAFLRNPKFRKLIKDLKRDGHYIGSHSDQHLLYCDWTHRDSLLVSKEDFNTDLQASYQALAAFGIRKAPWFLPPYEWYNQKIVAWGKEKGLQVINFTPGTGTNADYTWPGLPNYRSSDTLLVRLFRYDDQHSLKGAFLLIHPGTDPRRTDKFYHLLDSTILPTLRKRGYRFGRLPDQPFH